VKVGVLGLGRMGVPIAERLLQAGHELVVYNRTAAKAQPLAERGATVLAEPRELLQRADAGILMVADDAALEDMTGAVLEGARSGTVLIDMSTVSPAASARAAAAAADRGVDFLRAPVSGNPGVVRAGRLAIIVSGPRSRFDDLRPMLEDVGPKVTYVGPGEEARVIKLALNLLLAGTAAVMAETVALAERVGVDTANLLEVMAGSALGSPFVAYKTEPLLREDYSATFTTDMMRKDLELVRAQAAAAGVPVEVADTLQRVYDETSAAGHGDADVMSLLLRLRAESAAATAANERS
jgi:3-hydroxyisobutyrate dehydrogenase-like beta-hydroxyacid dehydrogenase